MQFKNLLICERCIIDKSTENLSLINIFDTLVLSTIPSVTPASMFYATTERLQEESENLNVILEIKINNTTINTQQIPISFQGKLKHRIMANISHIAIPEAGYLIFKMSTEDGSTSIETAIAINSQHQIQPIEITNEL